MLNVTGELAVPLRACVMNQRAALGRVVAGSRKRTVSPGLISLAVMASTNFPK